MNRPSVRQHEPGVSRIRMRDRFASLSVTMHECTRSIRIGHLGRSLDHPLTLIAMDRARANRMPESHDSDHGIRQVAPAFSRLLRPVDVEMSISDVGENWQDGPAEQLVRTVSQKEVDPWDYE